MSIPEFTADFTFGSAAGPMIVPQGLYKEGLRTLGQRLVYPLSFKICSPRICNNFCLDECWDRTLKTPAGGIGGNEAINCLDYCCGLGGI